VRSTRVTLRDIALAVGTSTSTVSLALRGNTRISAPMRERVRVEAERLGYQGDLAGSLLRTAKPRVLGLLCRLDQELHFTYHERILALAWARGYRVLVEGVSEGHPAQQAMDLLEQFRAQSIIVIDPRTLEGVSAETARVPLVTVGQERARTDDDLVVGDNASGIGELVDHLAGLGHRRVVHLEGPAGVSSRARRQALCDQAAERGMGVEPVQAGSDLDSGFRAMESLVEAAGGARGLPTAVVCYNDQCAQGAVIALLRAGLSVPGDVSVSGFDNSRIAASRALGLTSVDRRPEDIARHAVERAIARSEGDEGGSRLQRVASRLVVRTSTGPARPGRT
jgi:LacI family transcriptional regulator